MEHEISESPTKGLSRSRIAAEVRAELARQKKTNTELAHVTGISVDTLRRRLHGVKPFYVEELDAICRFLNLPMADLIERAAA